MNTIEETDKRYEEIDEELRPFSVLIEGLADVQKANAMNIEQMSLDIPFEIDVIAGEEGVTLGSAPPTQPVETTFMPVIHRMKLTITAVNKLYDE